MAILPDPGTLRFGLRSDPIKAGEEAQERLISVLPNRMLEERSLDHLIPVTLHDRQNKNVYSFFTDQGIQLVL